MGMGLPPGEQCLACANYQGINQTGDIVEGIETDYSATCKAFPDGIPDDLLTDKFKHTKPFKGDNGVMFEGKG